MTDRVSHTTYSKIVIYKKTYILIKNNNLPTLSERAFSLTTWPTNINVLGKVYGTTRQAQSRIYPGNDIVDLNI